MESRGPALVKSVSSGNRCGPRMAARRPARSARARYRRSLKNSVNLAASAICRPAWRLASYGETLHECPGLGQETPRCVTPWSHFFRPTEWQPIGGPRGPGRNADFIAQLIAAAIKAPQTRLRRRADAGRGHCALSRRRALARRASPRVLPLAVNAPVPSAALPSRPKRAYDARSFWRERQAVAYTVKEIFKTLQGEGAQAGRAAVFCRFAGCNLWSGREEDRATAVCQFCDTDFVGTDGPGGGRFESAATLARAIDAGLGRRPNRGASWCSPAASHCCSSMTR